MRLQKQRVLLFKVGAEQPEGGPAAGGGRGGLLPRFHRSLRSRLVIVPDSRRHDSAAVRISGEKNFILSFLRATKSSKRL